MGKFSLYIVLKSILSKNNRIYLTLFFVISCIITLIIYSNRWSGNITVTKISIKGNRILSKNEILSSLDNTIDQMKNKDIQLLKIKSEVETNPYIFKAFVMRKSLSEIIINVQERKPIAILVEPMGKLCFLDKNSVRLSYRISPYIVDMPLIRNSINDMSIDSEAIKGAIKILNNVNQDGNFSFAKYISNIVYNPINRNYSCLISNNFCKILLGQAINIKEKVDLLRSFWNNKLTNINMATINYIDLRWNNRVIVKFLT